MYVYRQEIASPNQALHDNKMSLLLVAMTAGKTVSIDYYYDASVSGWAACYLHDIRVLN